MTSDDIIAALEVARGVPKAALKAATQQPETIAPAVIACMERAAAGIALLPREESLVFYGIHALAAARHAAAFPAFMGLMRLPGERLDMLLGDAIGSSAGLMLGLCNGNVTALVHFLADPMPDGIVKWSAFQAFARLVCEGLLPRDEALALLARFRTSDTDPDDPYWRGWADAMIMLGAVDAIDDIVARVNGFEPRPYSPGAIAKLRAEMEAAAANPGDMARFDRQHIAPLNDAVAALDWVDDDSDSFDEERALQSWLSGFLDSDEVPSTAMGIEELDGFMTGLAVLPVPVPPARYVPLVWNDPSGDAMQFESAEKAALVTRILHAYPDALRARLGGGQMADPWVTDEDGIAWAQGFRRAMVMAPDEWLKLGAHPLHGRVASEIDTLANMPARSLDDYADDAATSRQRRRLADLARDAYRLMRGMPVAAARPDPVTGRVVKVGRNDPCPCGSGKKFKKCCGAVA